MSCGLHDVIALESRGIPAAVIGTEPFRTEADEQARVLGMPDQKMVEVPHPIQPISMEQVLRYADDVLAEAVARLLQD